MDELISTLLKCNFFIQCPLGWFTSYFSFLIKSIEILKTLKFHFFLDFFSVSIFSFNQEGMIFWQFLI